jgi:hypothetical protein
MRGARKVPTCCRELADYSGALLHGRAGHTALPGGLSARTLQRGRRAALVRKAHLGSMAQAPQVAAGPHQHRHDRECVRNRTSVEAPCAHTPVVPTPSTINSLTALSYGRTFPDSAVMTASNCRQRWSHTDRRLDVKGALSMSHCRVKRAERKGRPTHFHNFVPFGSPP